MLVNKEDALAHYGVIGMRWGHRKDGRPQGYQGDGNSRTRLRKLPTSATGSAHPKTSKTMRERFRDTRASLVERRVEKDAVATKNREELAKITHIKQRREALTTHDPKVLVENMHLLTDSELQSRLDRIKMEQQVRNMIPKEKSKGQKAFEGVQKILNSDVAKTVSKGLMDRYVGKGTEDAIKKATKDIRSELKKAKEKAAQATATTEKAVDTAEKAVEAVEEESAKRKVAEQSAQDWHRRANGKSLGS